MADDEQILANNVLFDRHSALTELGEVDESERVCCDSKRCCKKSKGCKIVVIIVLLMDVFLFGSVVVDIHNNLAYVRDNYPD